MLRKFLAAVVASLLLSSCSTMGKRECQSGEWQKAGYSDARKGLASSRFSKHAQACAKHAVESDENLYKQGYSKGLKEYCRPEIGLIKGREIQDYLGICPVDLEADFLQGYFDGLNIALHRLDTQFSSIRFNLQHARLRRRHVDSEENKPRMDEYIFSLGKKLREIDYQRGKIETAFKLWRYRGS